MENMPYVYKLPVSVSFRAKGLRGYSFGLMKQKDLEILYVESEKGHDAFLICQGITRTYYILSGNGNFTINGQPYSVDPGVVVEIPPGVEYSYSGHMTLLVFCKRHGFRRSDKFTRWNRDVVGTEIPRSLEPNTGLKRLIGLRIFGKSPTNAFLRLNQHAWKILPRFFASRPPLVWYGHFLHELARIQGERAQAFNTFFLRNRPELALIQRLAANKKEVRLAVLGCSTGAEVYSIAWAIKTARTGLRLSLQAVDISHEAVEFAKRAAYGRKAKEGRQKVRDYMAAGRWNVGQPGSELLGAEGAEIFERLTPTEMAELFDFDDDVATVKSSIRDGINWHVADVRSPELLESIGLQDIVVASNFLCHMESTEAERCLRNIARMVAPHGYIFVTGVDLDVRTKIAQELGWKPVLDLLEEVHNGDLCLRGQWPCQYAGLEPLNKGRSDWKLRYAAAFQVGSGSADSVALRDIEAEPVTNPSHADLATVPRHLVDSGEGKAEALAPDSV
jgi:chemotaxis methyl-accepting protein methylase